MHSQSSYFLCSVSDSMFLNPQGMVDLRGFGTMVPFLKNTLDKLGVKMEVFYAGTLKALRNHSGWIK
ncbi:MAG: S49 family peptidase [Saprospiraceae bacterium]|nr:S49 family peptidase [Saprospiraceae bacterium]